jgi:hypothetical protein
MELQDVHNRGFGDNSAGVTLPPHYGRLDRCIRFYGRRFHFITIPVGIIVACIHLRYALEYLGQCPIQPMINIYMIVHASVDLFLIVLVLTSVMIVRCIYSRSEEDRIMARRLILIIVILQLIVLLFSFSWLLAGSVWVFGAKSNGVQGSNSSDTTTYCQSDLYNAVFVLLILHYVIHGLIILAIIFMCTCCKRGHIVPPPPVVATDKV